MCILIDANQGSALETPSDSMAIVADWINSGGRVVAGGQLSDELKLTKFRRFLVELSRRGNLRTYTKAEVDAEVDAVSKLPLKSDDPHVVALARLSGARVAITNDNRLIADLKDNGICPGKRRAIRHRPGKPEMSPKAVKALLAGAHCK